MGFTPDELKKAVSDTLNSSVSIPSGHRGAVVAFVDDAGLRIAVATKIGDSWTVGSMVQWHDHEDGLSVGATIMKTW